MIGANIRKIRKSKSMKLKELAEKAGYSYNHIRKVETDIHIPKITTAIDIADVLGVTLDELVGREVKK